MEQLWAAEALRAHWVLTSQELRLLEGLSPRRRLVLGYYLKFFQRHARFPGLADPVPDAVGQFPGERIAYEGPLPSHVPERSDRRYRRAVETFLKLGRLGAEKSTAFLDWLVVEALPAAPQVSTLDTRMTAWFLANRVIQPNTARLSALVAKAERRFERVLHRRISDRLTARRKRDLCRVPHIFSTGDFSNPLILRNKKYGPLDRPCTGIRPDFSTENRCFSTAFRLDPSVRRQNPGGRPRFPTNRPGKQPCKGHPANQSRHRQPLDGGAGPVQTGAMVFAFPFPPHPYPLPSMTAG